MLPIREPLEERRSDEHSTGRDDRLSFYEAIDRIPLGIAVTIEFAGPLLVAVIGSRRPLDGVWIALAAAGIVVLVDPGGGSVDPAGVGFALATAGCWMAYIYLSKRTGAALPGGSRSRWPSAR